MSNDPFGSNPYPTMLLVPRIYRPVWSPGWQVVLLVWVCWGLRKHTHEFAAPSPVFLVQRPRLYLYKGRM